VRSPEGDASIPSSLNGIVDGVIGLDDSAQFVEPDKIVDGTPPAVYVNGKPCSAYYGELPATGFPNPYGSGSLSYSPCGYTPQQVKSAYGLGSTTLDGTGTTVAVIDAYADPTIAADVNQWSTNRGIPTFKGAQFKQVVAPGTYNKPESKKQDPQGWSGEETLDVEAVHGMAPGATVVYVGAPNSFQDLDAALNHVVDNHLADIVTNSYGFSTEALHPGFIKPYEDTIMQGVAEGIGIYFSSGDNGDESATTGYKTVDWPASSPYVTAVGGTSIGIDANGARSFEVGWGTTSNSWNATAGTWNGPTPGTWIYGGGGGVSTLFAEPPYQANAGVASPTGGRVVPDIAAIADPNTGFLIGQTQTFPDGTAKYSEYRIGGTSLSSPITAGIMALANQAAGGPLGFINPLIYGVYSTSPSAFYDVTSPATPPATVRVNNVNGVDASAGVSYSLRTFNQTQSLVAAPGYDDVTGVGTPTAALISALAAG
jgi:subtilase family serine protease